MFNIDEELVLYLVSKGLKPAGLIGLSALELGNSNITTKNKGIVERKRIKGFAKRKGHELVKNSNVYLFKKEFLQTSENYKNRELVKITEYDVVEYRIGFTKDNLEAFNSLRGSMEEGFALGYPEDSVNLFGKNYNGHKVNGVYISKSIIDAKNEGISIPDWFAYIQHVPKNFDLIEDVVCEESKIQGIERQDFVRKHNFDLAQKVEIHAKKFYESLDSYEEMPEGYTNIVYKALENKQ